MSELGPRYDHKEIEDKIYKLWEKSGYFSAEGGSASGGNPDKRKPYSIIMPPNNANGSLHLGHAVGLTLQDILIRYWRMQGRKTLWLPGADHAGFETQVVYDKKLDKEGRNRFTIPREELWREIWDFTQTNKKLMQEQTKKLGASCDWSRERFTLDPEIIKVVYETFEQLYKDGLAYRDLKVVNWCPKHRTALSDLEVKFVEQEDPLYFIKYGPLTVATVRPETKFGDTGLAVNPKDARYKKYIGKEIEATGVLGPLKFKVIADEAVDLKFGTGVVKVTPAHDQTDFEIWQRHKDEIPGPKQIIDELGRLMTSSGLGEYGGLKVMEAREKVVEAMKQIGILEKVDPNYKHQIATCYKCGNTLEPLPKMQWFIRMTTQAKSEKLKAKSNGKSLRDLAVEAVKSGRVKFTPKRAEKVFMHWMKNIRDWNISRQIVWGIRIPAWFCVSCGKEKINPLIKSKWFLVRHGETDWNVEGRANGHTDIPLNKIGFQQANMAAEKLKGENIDLVLCSDLKRASQTAEIIAKRLGVELIIDKDLRERNMGVVEGMLREEWKQKHPNMSESLESRPLDGESLGELQDRIFKTFNKHKSQHKHKNIVLVTHGGSIRSLLGKLRNMKFEDWAHLQSKNTEIFKFDISEDCGKCGLDLYEQDPDVFDTWFSSGQWPFATLMSRESSKLKAKSEKLGKDDFKNFYPTDVMETGYDILFFWVARMIMLGIYRTGKVPFKNVYLHGLVRDKDRQKMSKSKGNVIDPLGVAETYGTDAVRMALVVGNTPGNDIVISEDKIRGYRNFATKIWNVARFVMMNSPSKILRSKTWEGKPSFTTQDKKDLAALKKIKTQVANHIEKFEFHLASEKAYHYFWHTLADKIIEETTPRLNRKDSKDSAVAYFKLETVLLESLKILHPFMPYVTEEIWQKFRPGTILMIEKY